MTRQNEDDGAAVDRAFAEMVAAYHLTADRPAVDPAGAAPADAAARPAAPETHPTGEPDEHWADNHPLFRFPAQPDDDRSADDPEPEPREQYVPDPLPPLSKPGLPAVLGWLGIGWAALVVLSAAFGARFPGWVGWVAVVGFLGGFAVLISQLPRHRPPDAGDGAVL